MINYRIFGCIELLAIKMNLNLCRHEVWGDQNELLQPMIEFLVDHFCVQGPRPRMEMELLVGLLGIKLNL